MSRPLRLQVLELERLAAPERLLVEQVLAESRADTLQVGDVVANLLDALDLLVNLKRALGRMKE